MYVCLLRPTFRNPNSAISHRHIHTCIHNSRNNFESKHTHSWTQRRMRWGGRLTILNQQTIIHQRTNKRRKASGELTAAPDTERERRGLLKPLFAKRETQSLGKQFQQPEKWSLEFPVRENGLQFLLLNSFISPVSTQNQ